VGPAADLGQALDGGGEGVLLAREAGHEAAAADEAAVLEAAQGPLEVAPGERHPFVDGQVAEHDTPTLQQLVGHRLGQGLPVFHRL